MTTKLYVDDLSAAGLSTDYLYAKDSNIKADVKVDPVDNGGEKIATITVNGEATEISAINNDYNYTSFEVFPTNKDIPEGTFDTLNSLSEVFDWNIEDPLIAHQNFTGLEYKVTVQQNDTLRIQMHSTSPKFEQNVIIDWGDGQKTDIKSDSVETYELITDEDESQYYYNIVISHTYSGNYVNKKNIVKIFGNKYYMIRHAVVDDYSNLISRILDSKDLRFSNCILNVSSIAAKSNRILKIVCHHTENTNINNIHRMFAECKNLQIVDIYQAFFRNLTYTSQLFEACTNLIHSNVRLPSSSCLKVKSSQYTPETPIYVFEGATGFYTNCKNLDEDIEDLLPYNGFDSNIVDFEYTFNNCSKLHGKIDPDILWNNKGVKFINTEGCFNGCSQEILQQVPKTWASAGGQLDASHVIDFNNLININNIEKNTNAINDNFKLLKVVNKYNKEKTESGKYWYSDGSLYPFENSEYSTDFIEVDYGVIYKMTSPVKLSNCQFCIAQYDSDKRFISRKQQVASNTTIQFDEDVKYIRLSIYNGRFGDEFMFCKEEEYPDEYKDYQLTITTDQILDYNSNEYVKKSILINCLSDFADTEDLNTLSIKKVYSALSAIYNEINK